MSYVDEEKKIQEFKNLLNAKAINAKTIDKAQKVFAKLTEKTRLSLLYDFFGPDDTAEKFKENFSLLLKLQPTQKEALSVLQGKLWCAFNYKKNASEQDLKNKFKIAYEILKTMPIEQRSDASETSMNTEANASKGMTGVYYLFWQISQHKEGIKIAASEEYKSLLRIMLQSLSKEQIISLLNFEHDYPRKKNVQLDPDVQTTLQNKLKAALIEFKIVEPNFEILNLIESIKKRQTEVSDLEKKLAEEFAQQKESAMDKELIKGGQGIFKKLLLPDAKPFYEQYGDITTAEKKQIAERVRKRLLSEHPKNPPTKDQIQSAIKHEIDKAISKYRSKAIDKELRKLVLDYLLESLHEKDEAYWEKEIKKTGSTIEGLKKQLKSLGLMGNSTERAKR